ncbi:hypothetical protein SanaruYs_09580 [Chryseotalea sanaruensis]|uniref:Uncharacterized protein n=1 Tax=Chryseotalea sanaruensis TaxID=2482724 RepID=A0A401U779_9BACT|nr:hypothetical protein [Chryseotalea sanaruensis]GCC50740.1 hypothetical protein SanaruYs_09580 [Chryseotalea sanaruensis]
MKLVDAILLSASVAFFIMGLHQIMSFGFANGYWAVMISTVLFFTLIYRRVTGKRTAEKPAEVKKKKGKVRK